MANIWKKFKHFKMGQPGLFFHFFGLFRQILQFLWQIYVKKCPSNIQCQDSNQWPSKHESPPTTTRPGLPPNLKLFIPTSRHTAPRPFHYFSNSYLFPVRIKFPPLPDLHKKWKSTTQFIKGWSDEISWHVCTKKYISILIINV